MRSSTVGAARALGLLAAFLVVSVVSGGLLAGLFLPAVGATGSLTRSGTEYFASLQADIAQPPLSEQSVLLARDRKTVLARFYEENRSVVPLSRIAPVMRNAIISIEDSRFYLHGGVDPKGLVRAFVTNSLSDDAKVQGASTLTQQVVKNELLEAAVLRGDKEGQDAAVKKDNGRKLREVGMAIQLEKQLSKDRILERYLNIANFGDATYGIEAAAQYFFSTTAAKLTLTQAATLAGLVQEPGNYNPFKYAKRARDRRNTVLTRMRDLKYITPAQFKVAAKTPLGAKKKVAANGCITATDNMAYFCSYVRRMLEIDPRFKALGRTEAQRKNTISRGGLTIVSSIDPRLQRTAFSAVTGKVPIGDPSGVASSAVTLDPRNGQVLAMAQNKIYSPDEKQRGRTELNFGVDYAYGGSAGFQTGSTFKGFTLAAYLDAGGSLNDVIDGTPKQYAFRDFKSCRGMGSDTYTFDNAENGEEGPVSVLEATAKSINTAYVAIERKVDLCDLSKLSAKLGVHTAAPYDVEKICGDKSALTSQIPNCLPSLTLGPLNIAPLTMAAGYGTFAADGTHCPPSPVLSITNRKGKAVAVEPTVCDESALDPDVAHGVNYALKTVLKPGGTAARINSLGWPVAGKTGTADNSVDTWFVGYTKQRVTAVWVGDPTVYKRGTVGNRCSGDAFCRDSMNGKRIAGKQFGHVFGADIAAPIWRSIMGVAQVGQPKVDWAPPPPKMLRGSAVRVPDVVGQPIGTAFSLLAAKGFKPSLGPAISSPVPAGWVAQTSPGVGATTAPGSTILIYPSTGFGVTNATNPLPGTRPEAGKPRPGRPGKPVKPGRGKPIKP